MHLLCIHGGDYKGVYIAYMIQAKDMTVKMKLNVLEEYTYKQGTPSSHGSNCSIPTLAAVVAASLPLLVNNEGAAVLKLKRGL